VNSGAILKGHNLGLVYMSQCVLNRRVRSKNGYYIKYAGQLQTMDKFNKETTKSFIACPKIGPIILTSFHSRKLEGNVVVSALKHTLLNVRLNSQEQNIGHGKKCLFVCEVTYLY
jgi:hypothetical protein